MLAGPWENSSVVKIADGIAVLNTLDFFTPMVDEAEIQGRIAGSNVTSDIYALAVTNIVSVLSIMAYPEDMPDELAVGMLKGFGDFCREMGAPVVGGHAIRNPWPIIGGAATGVGDPEKIVYTRGAKPGDQLFLTKPLGIAPAMAAYRLRKEEEGKDLLKDIPESNHLQITYYALMLVMIYGVSELIFAYKQKTLPDLMKTLGVLIIAVILAIGSNFTQLNTTREYTEFTTRGR